MALFAIADLHLALATPGKEMDVFGGRWTDYTNKIAERWPRVVSPEDTVVLAGDTSWAMSVSEAVKDFDFLESLPGRKVILKGNHDFWWATKNKLDNFIHERGYKSFEFLHNDAVSADGFAVCGTRGWDIYSSDPHDEKLIRRELMRLENSCIAASKLGGVPVAFMHYPPVSDTVSGEAFTDIMNRYGIKRCYYGHIHFSGNHRAFCGDRNGIRFELISADTLDFIPLLVRVSL